jgi:transcriptional regulator with XRE-family HTH domain
MAQVPRELTPEASALHYFGSRLRHHRTSRGLSQQQLGLLVHVSGHLIGKIELAARWPNLQLVRRLDGALGAGGGLVGLWPLVEQSRTATNEWAPNLAAGSNHIPSSSKRWDGADDGTSEDMRRRDVWRLAVAGAALPVLGRLADCLTAYADTPDAADTGFDTLSDGLEAVASIKRQYQACRYATVFQLLPDVLPALQALPDKLAGDERSAALAVLADGYHVVGSVLLKLEDVPLATLAADRSMTAAQRSEDPIAMAGSARVVTHALMSGGHASRAHRFAAAAAQRLTSSHGRMSRDGTAVLGALLLRGGIAAARADDRDSAQTLLDEAGAAAVGMPDDGNDRWTGFNATNVMLHRVNSALALGDAGTAVHLAKHVNVAGIGLTERRVSLYLDLAQAYRQWGKWDQAVGALRRAAYAAPQEVAARAAARGLVEDLIRLGPRSARTAALDVAARTGLRL